MRYKIRVGKEKDTKALVKLGKYDWSNSDIFEFPFEKTEAKEIELIHFNKYISSEDAIKEMEVKGLRPATVTELLLFGAQYPEVQHEFPIVALGTVQQVFGDRGVACLGGGSAGRGLNLAWFEGGWYGDWRFAAVRKSESLDAGNLDLSR